MNRKSSILTIAKAISAVLLLVFLFPMSILAGTNNNVKSIVLTSSSPLPASAEDLYVVSYEQIGNQLLYGGMKFDLKVRFKDTRKANLAANKLATALVNTPSFRGDSQTAAVNSIGEYDMLFSLEYTGTGSTFQCDISYSDIDLPMKTLSVTLNNTRPSEDSSASVTGTGFVLKSVNYGENEIIAGKEFVFTATFIATEGTYSASNVSVTLSLPKNITVANGSPVSYIGTVEPGKTCSVSFVLLTSAVISEGSELLSLTISGINAGSGEAISSSADITVPIVQPERFEISNINFPENMVSGNSEYGSISVVNKGKGIIYNVLLEIDCEGIKIEEGKQFIGNLEPGTEKITDISIIPIDVGQFTGKILIIYENSKGIEKQISYEFKVDIEKSTTMQPDIANIPPPEEENSFLLWFMLIVVLLIIAGGFFISSRIKSRKIEEDMLLQEVDYDLENDDDIDELQEHEDPS